LSLNIRNGWNNTLKGILARGAPGRGRVDLLLPYRPARRDEGDGLPPRLMPPASPAVLVALRVRGAAVAFPGAWRSRFHRLPLRTICHVGLSQLSASPKSHFSPSPLPCASPGRRSRGHSAVQGYSDVSTLAGGVVAWRQAKRANYSVGASPSAGGGALSWCGLHRVTPSVRRRGPALGR
jgi:hypothetical protein